MLWVDQMDGYFSTLSWVVAMELGGSGCILKICRTLKEKEHGINSTLVMSTEQHIKLSNLYIVHLKRIQHCMLTIP